MLALRFYSYTIILVTLFVVQLIPVKAQPYITGKRSYVTQMHIHGWSNHNGAVTPGSMQYHNYQAEHDNVNVLWWADHHRIYVQDTIALPFTNGVFNQSDNSIENVSSPQAASFNRWQCLAYKNVKQIGISGDTLSVRLSGNAKVAFAPRSDTVLVKNTSFVKPIAAKPEIRFGLDATYSDSMAVSFQIVCRLAWHYRQQSGQDIVIFRFAPGVNDTTYSNGIDSVWVNGTIAQGYQQMAVNLYQGAALLDHGGDNTLSDFEFNFNCNSGNFLVQLSDCRIVPTITETDSIVQSQNEFIDIYRDQYHTQNILGVEYSGQQHLNGFFRKDLATENIFQADDAGQTSLWVDYIHQVGGLVSYNHPFGTDNTLAGIAIQDSLTEAITKAILDNNAYGADILEVGYLKRGGCDLEHHLEVWDRLTASRLFLYGNGVSDSHGGVWMASNKLFHTNIWSVDSTDERLLESLSLGKMYFGIHELFSGEFFYSIAGLEMGDKGIADKYFGKPEIHLTGVPADAKLKVTQGLLDSSPAVQYLHFNEVIDAKHPFALDLRKPCFIRFSLSDINDNPLAFGQNIVVFGVAAAADSIPDIQSDQLSIITYPNPVIIYLDMEINFHIPGNYSVKLYDVNGKLVKDVGSRYFYAGLYGFSLNLEEISGGTYFIKVTGQDQTVVRKILKL